ncbi:hypothetical protein [Polyangium jinanense]|uniref:Uncharacterized protein n=1 Tax=Polyangium jinanense TaxID=2829994 RepID=A0A9X4ARJ9_9BACT|nr:hypothetical protein [Polyangium jinanense]MDC3955523.1 hypothetical protein [Polyangium jinanense]MDC3982159.1 hypothetical protein [Polyangium jinanense]
MTRLTMLAFFALAFGAGISSVQAAEPPPAPAASPAVRAAPTPTRIRRWYGWQTLIGIGAADTVAFPLSWVKLALFGPITLGLRAFVPPIVHWSHGHIGKGFGSLALNLCLPAATAGIGFALGLKWADYSPGVSWISGGFIGILAAPTIDMAVLSTEEVEVPAKRASSPLLPRVMAVVPMVAADRVGLTLIGQL